MVEWSKWSWVRVVKVRGQAGLLAEPGYEITDVLGGQADGVVSKGGDCGFGGGRGGV